MGLLGDLARKLSWLPLVNLPVWVPLTRPHYYYFGGVAETLKDSELHSAESWDALRTQHPHFVVQETRDKWLASLSESKDGQDLALKQRAAQIERELRVRGITDVHSVGVGAGALEYFLKQEMPSMHITASEYAPANVARLRNVFHEANVIQFDIAQGDWSGVQPQPDCSAVLMYRVDPHFTNEAWRTIFSNMAAAGVENIIFIPATIVTVQYLLLLQLRASIAYIRGERASFTGYMRSAKVFPPFWDRLYVHKNVMLGGLPSYLLTRT
ncbi:hypothetical protein IVB40_32550 [Bradyrhizobium sp. 40]|uniref:class I SAM-dependent methyltransferase n=1 Tax=Bradyrhizobium sp. 40 TaxID=2782674 RepID=UPI001FFFFBF0|nr:class I SAM-dependent methyltransferase [Bradyrhizobium sp. 40]UPJ41956.1 hypothetical protein IVB40_32550 [Bradyrhizobium sp. 40]